MTIKILEKVKNWIYLIIPLVAIVFWAFISLAKDNFTPIGASDVKAIFYASEIIFTSPELIYTELVKPPFPYTPFIATIFFPLSLLGFEAFHWIYLIITLLLSLSCIIVFNQILELKKVDNKLQRFLFLMTISNGLLYVQLFDYLTSKMITAFFLVLFIKREIEYREMGKNREDTKFIFIQMMILMIAIGVSLQFAFYIILYLLHDIKIKEIFSKPQIKRYLLLILSFSIQNFIYILMLIKDPSSPLQIYFGNYSWGSRSISDFSTITYSNLVEGRSRLPIDSFTNLFLAIGLIFDNWILLNFLIISIISLIIITAVIHFQKNLSIEQKYGLLSLLMLFVHTMIAPRYLMILLPLIAILFLDFDFFESKNPLELIKKNYLMIIGLICIATIYFMPQIHYLVRVFPVLTNIPLALMISRWTYIYIVLTFVILFLFLKRRKNEDLKKGLANR